MSNLVSECKKLAQREHKRQHDIWQRLYIGLSYLSYNSWNGGLNGMKMYQVVENDEVKLLWDKNIQCDNVIEARRPDIYSSE